MYVSLLMRYGYSSYPRTPLPGWAILLLGGLFLIAVVIAVISYLRRQKAQQQARTEMDQEIQQAHRNDPVLTCPLCGTHNNISMTACVNCGGPLGLAAAMAGGGAVGSPMAAGPTTFAAPPPPDPVKTSGVIKHDVVIGGQVAFSAGDMVNISDVSPDASRPEYKYVVQSDSLGKSFRLSDNELMS